MAGHGPPGTSCTTAQPGWNAKRDASRDGTPPIDVELAMPSAYNAASAAGMQISPSKMRRLLRAGIASQQQDEQQDKRRRIAYRDPTGESAAHNVDKGRAG